jgi:hypothetical protein
LSLSLEQILQISSIYLGLSLFIQIPCGLIADCWGAKKNLFIYLIFQIISCFCLIFIDGHIAYHAFLLTTTIGQGFLGNGGTTLIRQYFGSQDNEFKKYSFEIQNTFYKFTSIIIITSVLIYNLNIYVPFVLQSIYFLFSFYYLSQIPEKYLSMEKSSSKLFQFAKNDILKSLIFIFKDKFYLSLIMISILFGIGVTINQKSIQSQLFSLFESHKIIYIGLTIAAGNLFSSIIASYVHRKFLFGLSSQKELILLTLIFIFSFVLMSFSNLITSIAGFLSINLFKGIYRPILGADLVNSFPFSSSINTNFSIIATITIITSSITQYLFSFVYTNVEIGNVYFIYFSLIVFLIIFIISKSNTYWKIKLGKNILTQKNGIIEKNLSKVSFFQIYPKNVEKERLIQISNIVKLQPYPANELSYFVDSHGEKGLKSSFLGEIHLSDILDPNKQFIICQKLLDAASLLQTGLQNALITPEYYIFSPSQRKMLENTNQLSKKCIIHGDLHPDNIMIINESPYVIDWDLCGNGPFWYDLFSLVTHPYLYFDKSKRYKLVSIFCESLSNEQMDDLFFGFCKFKIKQLNEFGKQDPKFIKLSKKYTDLIKAI